MNRHYLVIGIISLSLLIMIPILTACSASPAPSTQQATAISPAPVQSQTSPPSSLPLSQTGPVKIQFLAHSAFLITSPSGLKIVNDPYEVYGPIQYSPLNVSADIVIISHQHQDHNNAAAVSGQPEIVKTTGLTTVKGIPIKGIATWHDNVQGARSGPNTVFCFTVDGINFCHLGDLGHKLNAEQLAEIGTVDVLFLPVGGTATIDAKTATEICNDLKAKIIIPMHYKTEKMGLPFAPVDDFLSGKQNVTKITGSIYELKLSDIPSSPSIIVLQMAN